MTEGDVAVRQKLSGGRYSEQKAVWASGWLERLESGKSDATKAAEKSSALLDAEKPRSRYTWVLIALVFGLLLASVLAVWQMS
jgi:hypothetical protein